MGALRVRPHKGQVQAPVPRVLFVTRRYPPSVGGMQAHAELTFAALTELTAVRLISLGRRQQHLVWWLPTTGVRVGWLTRMRGVDHVVWGDALVWTALGRLVVGDPVRNTVFVHGRDLTFSAPLYRRLVRRALDDDVAVIANSRSTAEIAVDLGVDEARLTIVHPPVRLSGLPDGDRTTAAATLRRRLGIPAAAPIIATVGRLVERKGVAWFVAEVLPRLSQDTHFVVAGSGPHEHAIRTAVRVAGLEERVHLLGLVTEAKKRELLAGADVFVQPNIEAGEDVEGFGMAVVEAATSGLPVVGSRLQGVADAIEDGTTGFLCEPADADDYVRRLLPLIADDDLRRDIAARFEKGALERFGGSRYIRDMAMLLGERT